MKWMSTPHRQVTVGSEVFEDRKVTEVTVVRVENGWDTATILIENSPTVTATAGTSVLIKVKDSSEATWTTIFSGIIRTAPYTSSDKSLILLKCLGAGYPLGYMNCAEEYGTQGRRASLDTFQKILTDASYGVIPKHVNYVLGSANASGYSIDSTNVEAITGTVPYLLSPYKPVNKIVDDLCDLLTALKAGSAGPHWIVDTSSNFRAKTIGATQAGWPKYYGNSQTAATLTSTEYTNTNFEPIGKEANYVVYYGQWRRPSSGDAGTENTASAWTKTEANTTLANTNTAGQFMVGAYAVKAYTTTNPSAAVTIQYPSGKNAAWDFSNFTDFNTPNLNFYIFYDLTLTPTIEVRLCTDATNYYTVTLTPPNQQFQHYSIPVGPFFKENTKDDSLLWTAGGAGGAPDWSNINWIEFYISGAEMYNGAGDRNFFTLDGLHFGNATICRVAREKYPGGEGGTLGQAANPVKMKLIHDEQGHDDSLVASDDSGLMAQLAYSELLRLQKTSTVGSFTTSMIPDILPGQYLYIDKDWRITKLTHAINAESGYRTHFEVTDDLTNSHARPRYEDVNAQYAAIRPEWQDRQASSLKAGNIDVRITPLEKAY